MKKLTFIGWCILLVTSCSKQEEEYDFQVSTGDQFLIELEANWSAGYSWQWTDSDTTSILDTLAREFIPPETNRVGSPGVEEWRFIAMSPGEELVTFFYLRPGSPGSAPPDTRQFSVLVR